MKLIDRYRRENTPLAHTFGIEYPAYFSHPAAEYRALVNFVGVIDLTHWCILRVHGKDRVTFLNAMLTNDVASLQVNEGCHSLITTTKGKIIAELFVFVRDTDVLVLVAQGDANQTAATLQKHIITDDVTIDDLTASHGVLALEGPKSLDVLWRMFPTGPFPKERLQSCGRTFEDFDLLLMSNSVTGTGGYHMLIPAPAIGRWREYLVQAARGSDGLAVGSIAWNIRRTENGLPWYDVDFTGDNLPDESRLGGTISYSKGCFLGHETLSRLHHRGHVNRLLVGLTPDIDSLPETVRSVPSMFDEAIHGADEADVRERAKSLAGALDLGRWFVAGSELYTAEDPSKPVGRITSSIHSPRLGTPLILGYVRRELVEGKTGPLVGGTFELEVTDLPVP